MKRLLLLCAMAPLLSRGQDMCPECRYTTEVFAAVDSVSVPFASGMNSAGQQQDLSMTVFTPVGDTAMARPVLVFAFGGAFLTGNRHEEHAIRACERFAKAGYTAVSIDYRIGFDYLYGILNGPDKEAMRVFFRAMQDLRAAVQYMRWSADQDGNPFRVDTNRIFLGGASSGSITAMMTQYVDTPEELAEIADLSAIDAYGGFYASSANGPHAGYPWHGIGVVNIAGAMPETDWIEPGDAPLLSAHGDQDQTVPYADAAVLNVVLPLANIQFKGSYLLDQYARQIGVCSNLYTMVGEDHPSNGRSDYYYDNIFNRLLPRMRALIEGRTFCCGLQVVIPGDTLRAVQQPLDAIELEMQATGTTDPLTYHWCALPCSETGSAAAITAHPQPDTVQYFIATAETATCAETDFVAIRIDPFASISDPDRHPALSIWPNPAVVGEEVRIEAEGTAIEVRAIATDGRTISLETTKTAPGLWHLRTGQLPTGIFALEVRVDGRLLPAARLVIH